MFDRRIQVTVRIVAEQFPQKTIGFEGDGAFLFCGIKEKRNEGILADILGDVLLGVIGPHLFLVDVFFENIPHHVGVDLVIHTQRPIIQMPAVLVKEGKQFLEGMVRNINIGILHFQLMHFKKTAVQKGNPPQELLHGRVELAIGWRLTQAVVKQAKQEISIEGLESVLAAGLLNHCQAILQIVGIAVQKPFFLDKIHKHQAVERQRRVPCQIGCWF